MVITITEQEVLANKENVDYIFLKVINEYIRNNKTNPKLSRDYITKIQALVVLVKVIETWEQGEFTDANYTNYIDLDGYLKVYKNIETYV